MIASQLGRAARATTTVGTCTAHRAPAATLSAKASSFTCPQRTHQRRPSSSKASCPPDEGSNGARPSAAAPSVQEPARSPASKGSGAKQTRGRKPKDADKHTALDKTVGQATDSTFDNLPSVPTISHMRPSGESSIKLFLSSLGEVCCTRESLTSGRHYTFLFLLALQTAQLI